MVLDNTSTSNTERSEANVVSGTERSLIYLLPSLLYCMEKAERKLIKLQTKAQECVSREKAVKIIKKANKAYEKASIIENR